jgi:FKBP-type peptidyl-prolyl cis-trans isomerase 2
MNLIKKRYAALMVSILLSTILLAAGCSAPKTAKSGDTVKVDYTGKLADGTVFDTSVGKTPLQFTLGTNQVIAGFDKAVTGMKVGESKTVTIPADEAYGQHRDDLLFEVDRTRLPKDMEPKVGVQVRVTQSDGSTAVYPIVKVDDTTVTLDTNSPLAGKDLTFEIKLLEITANKTTK